MAQHNHDSTNEDKKLWELNESCPQSGPVCQKPIASREKFDICVQHAQVPSPSSERVKHPQPKNAEAQHRWSVIFKPSFSGS
jgi:hypothetical protein